MHALHDSHVKVYLVLKLYDTLYSPRVIAEKLNLTIYTVDNIIYLHNKFGVDNHEN